MNAIEWAKEIVEKQGWEKAYSIAASTGREYLKPGIRNPYASFFKQARLWMQANAPMDLSKITIEIAKDESSKAPRAS